LVQVAQVEQPQQEAPMEVTAPFLFCPLREQVAVAVDAIPRK
jgi:hypothetical protein